ncbi:MAG: IPT/TIG domain-containing protein [Planctomycetales bacterium]|nr:IPT/TIG domain-containing protein [Planctomycetales bacterium]
MIPATWLFPGVVWLLLGGLEEAPRIRNISPDSGSPEGGTTLTIEGDGFEPGASVTVQGRPATFVAVVSPNKIIAITPPGTAGAAVVTVSNPAGLTASRGEVFRYRDPAAPTEGPAARPGAAAAGFPPPGPGLRLALEGGAGGYGRLNFNQTGLAFHLGTATAGRPDRVDLGLWTTQTLLASVLYQWVVSDPSLQAGIGLEVPYRESVIRKHWTAAKAGGPENERLIFEVDHSGLLFTGIAHWQVEPRSLELGLRAGLGVLFAEGRLDFFSGSGSQAKTEVSGAAFVGSIGGFLGTTLWSLPRKSGGPVDLVGQVGLQAVFAASTIGIREQVTVGRYNATDGYAYVRLVLRF